MGTSIHPQVSSHSFWTGERPDYVYDNIFTAKAAGLQDQGVACLPLSSWKKEASGRKVFPVRVYCTRFRGRLEWEGKEARLLY